MKKILILSFYLLLIVVSDAQASDSLMHQSHDKLKQAQKEMQTIKNTDEPGLRKQLLDQHLETMGEFNSIMLKIQQDPQRGGEGQGTAMADIMAERVRYLEYMMQQLIENQSERLKLEN